MKNKEQTKKIKLYILLIIVLLTVVIQVAQFFVSSNVKAKLPISSSRIILYLSVVLSSTKLIDKKNNWFSIIIFGLLALLEIVDIFI